MNLKLNMMNSKYAFAALALFGLMVISCMNKEKKAETASNAQKVIEQTVKVVGKEIAYATDSTNMKGYITFDENSDDKRPGVIVVHEWWGHNDYTRQRADMLAELGYTAIAIDMYGDGKQAAHPADAGKFMREAISNMPEAKARFAAALDLLKKHPSVDTEKIAAIGYCFGGSVVLTMANAGMDLDAVAAFHSGVQLPVMPSSELKAKVLVCNGAEDPFISPESVVAFKKAMDSVGADYKYIAYEGALHAFTSKVADSMGQKFDLPLAYQQKADESSWNELQELLGNAF